MNKLQKKSNNQQSSINKTYSKGKNVSWADNSDEKEDKIQLPSTPYPKRNKKVMSAISTPKILSFKNKDLTNNQNGFTVTKSSEQTINLGCKRHVNNGWTVTDNNKKFKPDTHNLRVNQNKKSQKNDTSLKQHTRNYKADNNNTQDESSDDSDTPVQLIPIEEQNLQYDHDNSTIFVESSSEEDINNSEDSNDLIFGLSPIKLAKESCKIIKISAAQSIEQCKDDTADLTSKTNIYFNVSGFTDKKLNNTTNENISNCEIAEQPVNKNYENGIKDELYSIDVAEKIQYFIGKKYCIIALKHPFKLYFQGKLLVKILSGVAEILGYTLDYNDSTEREVYCPRGQSFLCIETIDARKRNPDIKSLLKNYDMSTEQINNFCDKLKKSDCIIAVKNLNNKMSDYLAKHVAQRLYPINSSNRPLFQLENKLNCLFESETASLKLFKRNENWLSLTKIAMEQVQQENSRLLFCGGKNVGKSMLLRFVINNMLNKTDKVVCIDLDPGQSEFTISGCVSVTIIDAPIFGPNYTHLKKPEKCFFFGDINVANRLNCYVSSVQGLVNYCEQNISKNIPWVINTMGFTRSIGLDIIILTIKLFKPSIVVQIESDKKNRNFEKSLTNNYVNNFKPNLLDIPDNHVVYSLRKLKTMAEGNVAGEWISEPRFLREMCILSYFSQTLQENDEITAVTPYSIKLSSIDIHNINYFGDKLLATINGTLIALCTENDNNTAEGVYSCLGYGIVRGIDKENDELYVITPLTLEQLENVHYIVRGNIALPPSIYMTSGHHGLVPYISLGIPQGTSEIPKRSFKNWKLLLKKK